MKSVKIAVAFALAVGLVACGGGKKAEKGGGMGTGTVAEKPLYERLGGEPAITKVVDDFVGIVAADDRINHFFANANIPHLKEMLVKQIGAATGGPQKYDGKSMPEAHAGMNITDADFGALVEDLGKALDMNKVPEKEKGELVGALGPLKDQIVGK